jgi:hypothetical protein
MVFNGGLVEGYFVLCAWFDKDCAGLVGEGTIAINC